VFIDDIDYWRYCKVFAIKQMPDNTSSHKEYGCAPSNHNYNPTLVSSMAHVPPFHQILLNWWSNFYVILLTNKQTNTDEK